MAALLLLGGSRIANGQQAAGKGISPCLPADDAAAGLVNYVKELLTGTSAGDVTIRQNAGLTNVSPSQVSLVTSGTACAQAAAAVDKQANTPNSGRRVYLVKVGTKRYAVRDPNDRAGEYSPVMIFDNKWVFIMTLLD